MHQRIQLPDFVWCPKFHYISSQGTCVKLGKYVKILPPDKITNSYLYLYYYYLKRRSNMDLARAPQVALHC